MGNYIFFLLMGYFYDFNMTLKKRMEKILKLSIEVYFYAAVAVMIFLISYVTGIYQYEELGTRGIIVTLAALCLPVTSEAWWFITTYIFILVILGAFPTISLLRKEQFKRGMLVFLLLNAIRLNAGSYNKIFINIFVVLIGIYIRKYINISEINKRKKYILAILSLFFWIFSAGCSLYFYKYHVSDVGFIIRSLSTIANKVGGYAKLAFAVCILLWFISMPIKENRYINKISKATFGIYLLHGSVFFVELFFHHWGIISTYYGTVVFPLVFVAGVGLIFGVGLFLDTIQKFLNIKIFNGTIRLRKKYFGISK